MDDAMITDVPVSEIIDGAYKEFAMYTLEQRAIPSVIDGFKPVHRKLVYAMLNNHPTGKVKVAELGGMLNSVNYHHGESSAMGAVVSLAAEYNNNAPVFDGHGAFGTRLVQEAASPRYIYASLSKNFKKYFIDEEVAPVNADTDNPEPAHYLPTIPWVLVNGISGIAVGFKTSILPRQPKDLVKAVARCIDDREAFLKANKIILPSFPQFKGVVEHVSENQYLTRGVVEYAGKYTYKITEVPVGHDRASYIKILNDLYEADKIKDYEDNCSKEGFGFSVKVSISQKSDIDKDPVKFFKLEKTHTEILTTLGVDGKLKIFNNVSELIDYFVTYRTTKFQDKLDYDIAKVEAQKYEAEHRREFIKLVIDGKVDFRKVTKAQLLEFIYTNVTDKEFGKKFVSIPLYECTTDSVNELTAKIEQYESELVELNNSTPRNKFKIALKSVL